ncbi:hypothetical protein C1752_14791 [Acaryochloris thomasi RCC1774]|uniref:Uncharacterized protein n=1 Tax=Acaryochloris thomasi RCC1774 TaxID=1764569 RepID=A0A2W1J7Z0_9CYAN|nr:hypothetical protein [Acaryochloris thomasi]PZD70286.1 hypothetical protein C1752_14791 [Acaryochloris thomasi RCC1774]
MKMKRAGILLLLLAISIAMVRVLVGTSTPASSSSNNRPEIPVDKDCRAEGWTHTLIGESSEAGVRYQLVDSQDPDGYYHLNVVQVDNAGCKALTYPGDDHPILGNHVPYAVAVDLAKASWSRDMETMGGKQQMEQRLASTTVSLDLGDNIDLYSWDLAALDQLGVNYPDYVKPLDEFASRSEAQEYYEPIYTKQWQKENNYDNRFHGAD